MGVLPESLGAKSDRPSSRASGRNLAEAIVELSNVLNVSTDQCGMGKRVVQGWLIGTFSVWGVE